MNFGFRAGASSAQRDRMFLYGAFVLAAAAVAFVYVHDRALPVRLLGIVWIAVGGIVGSFAGERVALPASPGARKRLALFAPVLAIFAFMTYVGGRAAVGESLQGVLALVVGALFIGAFTLAKRARDVAA